MWQNWSKIAEKKGKRLSQAAKKTTIFRYRKFLFHQKIEVLWQSKGSKIPAFANPGFDCDVTPCLQTSGQLLKIGSQE